jgi:uncharacterized protein YcfJ
MNRTKWMSGLLIFASGCATMNNTEAGAVQGGVIGAFTGAVIGALVTHNPWGLLGGAVAGGAAGAAGGALAGNSVDQRQQAQVQAINDANERATQAALNPPFSVGDIGKCARDGWTDAMLMNQIIATGSTYILSPDQVDWLRNQTVSNRVIEFMQSRAPRYVHGRLYAPPPVVVAPPVAVGIGVGVR